MEQLPTNPTEEHVYNLAIKRLNIKKNLLLSFVTYVTVNAFLAMIDIMYSGATWFYYVLAIWGVMLVSHVIKTVSSLKYSHDHRNIKREIDKMK